MSKIFRSNGSYFLKEAITVFRLNLLSNLLSLFSISLIFFIFAMMFCGWQVGNHVAGVLQSEAEINVYYSQNIGTEGALQLAEQIKGIYGVKEARLVDEKEAYDRMEKILGEESKVLDLFEENPFSPFLEVKIDLEQTNLILGGLKVLPGIEHVRNNKDVLDRIGSLARTIRIFGALVVIAVGISTLVIVSHMIRQGVEQNKGQISTLRLLGAPEIFIGTPFLLEGLFLTLGGALLAVLAAEFVISQVTSQLWPNFSFIPLPPAGAISQQMFLTVGFLALLLGIAGSLLGLSSAKTDY